MEEEYEDNQNIYEDMADMMEVVQEAGATGEEDSLDRTQHSQTQTR